MGESTGTEIIQFCKYCNTAKTSSDFYKSNKTRCKACKSEERKKYGKDVKGNSMKIDNNLDHNMISKVCNDLKKDIDREGVREEDVIADLEYITNMYLDSISRCLENMPRKITKSFSNQLCEMFKTTETKVKGVFNYEK